ncbi:MAG: hypothetical protein IJ728_12160 [Selenomonadaceae bacterium]|nr:hypothetical protein [Selenomonadaceae bacterium]
MRVYFDICCYNRRFDDKSIGEISLEYRYMIEIQKEIVRGNIELVTSFMLHYENYQKKDIRKRNNIDFFIKNYRKIYIGIENIEKLTEEVKIIVKSGIKEKDAYHIASAILADCDYFVTVDKRLLKFSNDKIKIINLIDFMEVYRNGKA